MHKNRKDPMPTLKFMLMSIAGLVVDFCCMIYTVAVEKNVAAMWSTISTIAISLWVNDVCSNKTTKSKNENIVLITVLMIMIRSLCATTYFSNALMIMIIIEFVFMIAIAKQTDQLI